ncbi:MAG: substrate-binding domain-containing protein [Desulfobacterales bacterium]|nr:substrate-binding domain-containing protein [Desulfobacterales bacterium]
MKRLLLIVTGLCILLSASMVNAQSQNLYKIGILMWHESPHDEKALQGFITGIELSGIPHEFDLKRTYGDESQARIFLQNWKEKKVDLIFTIGTKGTLWAMEEINNIPIVFTAVTDPVASGIAESWQYSGRNVTGSSNWIKFNNKLKIFKEAIPHLKKLGVIYRADNPVPLAEIVCARDCAPELNVVLKEALIEGVEQIEGAIEGLIAQGVDALWIPIEDMVYQDMSHVGRITIPAKLPVVSSTLEALAELPNGDPVAMVSVTVDYESQGRLSVPAAIEILTKKKDPKDIPIITSNRYYVTINVNAADIIRYQIPPVFLSKADKVLRGFTGQKLIVSGTGDSQELLREAAKFLENKLGGGEILVPESIGSGGGVRAAAAGEIGLGRVARPLTKSEVKLGLNYKRFARCPVVFVVHPSVNYFDNLTAKDIVGIYSGEITDWGRFGVEGKIYAVGREPGDSCLIVLNKLLPGFKDIIQPRTRTIYNTPDAVAMLMRHQRTIGYLPISMTVGTNLRILKIDGVYPSAENVRNGKYKFVVPFAFVYRDNPTGLAKRFVDFLDSDEGQQIIRSYGVVPE